MRFIEKMKNNDFSLVVSCPKNDYDFVKAAWENGADAVKIHLNVHHHASGTDFKSLTEELDFIRHVLDTSPVPVGVVVGGDPRIVRDELPHVLKESFDFLSLYLHDAPSDIISQSTITKMLACNYQYSLEQIRYFEKIGVEVCEVSIVHPDDYGKPLTLRDMVDYKKLIDTISIPALLPTQKKVLPSEVKVIRDLGFKAIMIGAVVTSNDLETYTQAIRDFRSAIDAL